ncbi:MAG: efflux RND transporter permease subunit [Gammaproteobacteria bacterium]|nr:efflux RND transporter permease subunit [Gammaproteobacteria bacterium]
MKQAQRTGGLAAWSIHNPVGISMLALTVVVIGFFSLDRLGVDLLPNIIYPEIRVRIMDEGVPATIMEDQITRQLEEQLAITENAIQVQSFSREGQSQVNLSFPYGTDIDIALRDASTRLDRAKRFLPETIDPPIIYKRDPAQIPIFELILSSNELDPVELRSWADYTFSKWFLNLPGVAAVEVGGGLEREITIIADQDSLANIGMTVTDLAEIIQSENYDAPGGQLQSATQTISTRSQGRFNSIDSIKDLPLWINNADQSDNQQLADFASIIDSHEEEQLRIRLNKTPGVKLSIQKQPTANTIEVVNQVKQRIDWLKQRNLISDDIAIDTVSDQSVFIRHSLRNAEMAALIGTLLAMSVIYLFLGSLRRTLIIGTAIPLGVLVTFTIMAINGLTLNIMTLGGLALGLGLLIDSTIVMLENITRHQHETNPDSEYAIQAAMEVNSPIVASAGTNLAAILPFLFIGGLTGLLFQELIITISSAMLAAVVVALTLVPALGAKIKSGGRQGFAFINSGLNALKDYHAKLIHYCIQHSWKTLLFFIIILFMSFFVLWQSGNSLLPTMDDGRVTIYIGGDADVQLKDVDMTTEIIEDLLLEQPEVSTVFALSGGRIFGRSQTITPNRSTIVAQLVPSDERQISSQAWVQKMQQEITKLQLTGYKIRMRVSGVRGLHLSSGEDDISLRIQGDDLQQLQKLGTLAAEQLENLKSLQNITHTYEESSDEIKIIIDRQRASDLGIRADQLGQALRIAVDGVIVSTYIEGDREYNIRLRLPPGVMSNTEALEDIIINFHDSQPIRLGDIASIEHGPTPSEIMHDQQQRVVEISASLAEGATLGEVSQEIENQMQGFELPEGYAMYDSGSNKMLQSGRKAGIQVLLLAIFLVFAVMAIHYESLRNPLIIISSVPFAAIGVAFGLGLFDMAISMSVWLGLIMLAGIVVNNAIMLVEQIEIERGHIADTHQAIIHAASLRLRPILMTTLTTVFGMLPLAIGLGEGSEMLQPLAFVIVWGLSFSMIVSLILIPSMYQLFHLKN